MVILVTGYASATRVNRAAKQKRYPLLRNTRQIMRRKRSSRRGSCAVSARAYRTAMHWAFARFRWRSAPSQEKVEVKVEVNVEEMIGPPVGAPAGRVA